MCGTVFSQLPGFDIYLMYIGGNEDSGYVYSEPLNITNRAGYDNQPSLSADGRKLLYTSIRDEKQADIYIYDRMQNTTQQFTHTEESEYSPVLSTDGKFITAVRVEKDSAQRLWQFKMKNAKAAPLLRYTYDVGYYCRVGPDAVALFQLPEPFTLKLASIREQDDILLDDNIGRCIKTIPGENAFSYITIEDSVRELKKFDMSNGHISTITRLEKLADDYAWYRDGNMFMADGSTLYYYDYKNTGNWFRFDDLSKFGIGNIYRIAFSADGNWMAFVAEEPPAK